MSPAYRVGVVPSIRALSWSLGSRKEKGELLEGMAGGMGWGRGEERREKVEEKNPIKPQPSRVRKCLWTRIQGRELKKADREGQKSTEDEII